MILGLQISGIVFSLVMIYFASLHHKKGTLSSLEVAIWSIIWVGVILTCLFPAIFRIYSQAIGVSRLLDLLIAGGFIVVIVLTASAFVRVKKTEKKLEELIRKLSIKEASKRK